MIVRFNGSSSPQTVTTGESDQSAGSHMRNTIHMRNSISSPVAAFKSFDLAQALLNCLVVVGGLVALLVVVGGIPFAIGLLLFAEF